MESDLFRYPLAGVTGVLLFVFLWKRYRRPANFPPGPPNLPFLGSTPFIPGVDSDYLTILEECRKKYGNIFSLRIANNWTVVLSDHDSITEACITRGRDFSGRPLYPFERNIRPCYPEIKGIISGDFNEEWRFQRWAGLHVLREMGSRQGITENRILEEAEYLKQSLKAYCGKGPFNPSQYFYNAASNIIVSTLVGKHYNYKDSEFSGLQHAIQTTFQHFATDKTFLPFQRYLPIYKEFLKEVRSTYNVTLNFLRKHIDCLTHKATTLESPSCFIDGYLKILSTNKAKMQNWLLPNLEDLIVAGLETTSTTLGWAMYCMVMCPEVQKKVQEELDNNLQNGQKPSLKYRANLPYTEAAILEIFRLASTVPLGVAHKTLCDTYVQGYNIPKDVEEIPCGCELHVHLYPGSPHFPVETCPQVLLIHKPHLSTSLTQLGKQRGNVLGNKPYRVIMLLWNLHRNPNIWPEPEMFKPERFLDKEGQVINRHLIMPFGTGRRRCLGEQLARQQLFLFFTTIVQSFTVTLPEGATLPPPRGELAITHRPPKFDICLCQR